MSLNENNAQIQVQSKFGKVSGIILAIIMVLVGTSMFITPLRSLLFIEYLTKFVLIVFGIFLIVKYAKSSAENKNGCLLANGIIITLLGVLYLFAGPALTMITFSLLFAFILLTDGIDLFILSSKQNKGKCWSIVGGILDIILFLFLIAAPFSMNWAIALIIGMYLIVSGIALFIRSCSVKSV